MTFWPCFSEHVHCAIEDVGCLDGTSWVVSLTPFPYSVSVDSELRNFVAMGANFSQYWKMPPWPEFR